MDTPVEGSLIEVPGAVLEVYDAKGAENAPVVCAAHPVEAYVPRTAALLANRCGARVVCVNPRGVGGASPRHVESLEVTVQDLDLVRRRLGIERWVYWGSSGGGWLAQVAARRFPQSLLGVILESACACYAERIRDPGCVLCPGHSAWRAQLTRAGLWSNEPSAGVADEALQAHGSFVNRECTWRVVPGVGRVLLDAAGQARLVLPGDSPDTDHLRRVHLELLKFDSRPWLKELRVPALILAGTDDAIAPVAHCRALAEALPHSSFVLVEGAGHNPGVHGEPRAVQAIFDFLKSVAPMTPLSPFEPRAQRPD